MLIKWNGDPMSYKGVRYHLMEWRLDADKPQNAIEFLPYQNHYTTYFYRKFNMRKRHIFTCNSPSFLGYNKYGDC